MYLTRTAGIETKSQTPKESQLNIMYLTRTAGIETSSFKELFHSNKGMYLTRTAGIETSAAKCTARTRYQCILPALRELKQLLSSSNRESISSMYLTRTAGIETMRLRLLWLRQVLMYLTRTAGIFAFYSPIKNTSFGGTHRPEWRVFCSFFFILLVYEKKPPSCEEG